MNCWSFKEPARSAVSATTFLLVRATSAMPSPNPLRVSFFSGGLNVFQHNALLWRKCKKGRGGKSKNERVKIEKPDYLHFRLFISS